MLPAFPKMFPNELYKHTIARYKGNMGLHSDRDAIRQITGDSESLGSIYVPNGLKYLYEHLTPGRRSFEEFIWQCTSLKLFQPFMIDERFGKLYNAILDNRSPDIHRYLGTAIDRIAVPIYFQYCYDCVDEDRKIEGEAYFHREHHQAGVKVCSKHNVWLDKVDAPIQNTLEPYRLIRADNIIPAGKAKRINSSVERDSRLLNIAIDTSWLLEQSASFSLEDTNARYKKVLSDKGLATYHGRTRLYELYEAFENYYSADLLAELGCSLYGKSPRSDWLARMLHSQKTVFSPLYHLLLIQFLGGSASKFFAISSEDRPFGDGPWPCLNPACSSYSQSSIKNFNLDFNSTGSPRGTFSCICGFTYTRIGPDHSHQDSFHATAIIERGPIWEEKLRELWNNESVTLKEIERALHTSQPVAKRLAGALGLPFPRPGAKTFFAKAMEAPQIESKLLETSDTLRKRNRKVWLSLVQNNPEAGVNKLRRLCDGEYSWLLRDNKKWLRSHSPRQKRTLPIHVVDWAARDIKYSNLAKTAAAGLRSSTRRPSKITATQILKAAGIFRKVKSNLFRLPLTKKVIEDMAETNEGFAIRRIIWLTDSLRIDGYQIPKWKFIKLTGIETIRKKSSQVEEKLQWALNELASLPDAP